MEDLPVEQLVKVKTPVTTYVLKALLILACALAAFSTLLFGFWGFLALVGVGFLTWFLFRRFNLEYEYSLFMGELTVDKIFSKQSRKRVGVWNLKNATLVAKTDSQDAMRLERKELPTKNFTGNQPGEEKVVIYTMDDKDKEVRLLIAPNEKVCEALGRSVPRTAFKL